MKKVVISLILLACVCAVGFAEHETWITAGGAYGKYFLNGKGLGKSQMESFGMNVSFYTIFRERNIGLFSNWGILFPVVENMEHYTTKDQFDFILAGVTSAYSVSENLKIYYGIGPAVNLRVMEDLEVDDDGKLINNPDKAGGYLTGLGIGGDMGFKINFPGMLSISYGITFTWLFAAHQDIRFFDENHAIEEIKNEDFHKHDVHSWVKGFSTIGIRPYISVGVHFY